jgi:hypothetical protein
LDDLAFTAGFLLFRCLMLVQIRPVSYDIGVMSRVSYQLVQ